MKLKIMALSALAMLVVAPTANATPPNQERFSAFVEGGYHASCGDFVILSDLYFDLYYKFFYDQSGNLIRVHEAFRADGWTKYYNSEDPTHFVEGGPNETQNARIEFVDGNPDTIAIMGPAWRINLPGQGVIFLMAGRLVVNLVTQEILFEAGPQDMVEGNVEKLCAALR